MISSQRTLGCANRRNSGLSDQPDEGSRYQHEADGDEVLAFAVTLVTQGSALIAEINHNPGRRATPEQVQTS